MKVKPEAELAATKYRPYIAIMDHAYETDFYAWANQQAALLRSGNFSAADIANIAEEIESMGKTEKRELISRLTILFVHLLKWHFQANLRGRSWRLSIVEQRKKIAAHLLDNPSLKAMMIEAAITAYDFARIEAAQETTIDEDGFPELAPWPLEQALDENFWPE